MASKARQTFDASADDVDRLLEIHTTIGGDAVGRRHRLEVLNKSAVVLITAFWEAYCEDLAAEALDVIVAKAKKAPQLPKELRKRVAKEVSDDKNQLACWGLADKGWRSVLKKRLADLRAERNRRLNTPKTTQINELFSAALGLSNVAAAWRWRGIAAAGAQRKLDRYVTLRGNIAHRGEGLGPVRRAQVEDYFAHVKQLVERTDNRVTNFVRQSVGQGLW